jgi:hypothetical protein
MKQSLYGRMSAEGQNVRTDIRRGTGMKKTRIREFLQRGIHESDAEKETQWEDGEGGNGEI